MQNNNLTHPTPPGTPPSQNEGTPQNFLKKSPIVSPIVEEFLPATVSDLHKPYLQQTLAPATKRSYASDIKQFIEWCKTYSLSHLPTTPGTIAAYLSFNADRHLRPSTLVRHVAAIRFYHEANCQTLDPTSSPLVKNVMKGIKRQNKGIKNPAHLLGLPNDVTKGFTSKSKKSPLTHDKIAELLLHCGTNIKGLRDKALLLIGFAGALRRSELLNIKLEDLELVEEGLKLHIHSSKTDQEGKGHTVAIPNGTNLPIVESLMAWLTAANITKGHIFRSINRHGHISPYPMSGEGFAILIKELCKKASLDEKAFSPHSLRSGFITSSARNGANIYKVMEVSRHKKPETVMGYIKEAELFKDHAGEGFL